jgi:aspartyl-tRNA(Asn)/glutamyl-tRNA(Gln) amidotransferase subunit A
MLQIRKPCPNGWYEKGDQALSPANTFFANYYGLPSVSIPVDKDSNGLPFGIQLISRANAENLLFEATRHIKTQVLYRRHHTQL